MLYSDQSEKQNIPLQKNLFVPIVFSSSFPFSLLGSGNKSQTLFSDESSIKKAQ